MAAIHEMTVTSPYVALALSNHVTTMKPIASASGTGRANPDDPSRIAGTSPSCRLREAASATNQRTKLATSPHSTPNERSFVSSRRCATTARRSPAEAQASGNDRYDRHIGDLSSIVEGAATPTSRLR
jgi:hypothetical protein